MPSKFKSSARVISVDDAVGTVMAHDITEIRPGNFKGPAFKKGHRVQHRDIERLKRLGKEHLYILNISPGELHENDAALLLARALAGENIVFDPSPSEGKITLTSACRGLLKVNQEALTALNMIEDISSATRHTNTLVDEGDIVAMTRAVPLIIDESKVRQAVAIAEEAGGVLAVKACARPDVGLVITGNEVYYGRIEDKFASRIRAKMAAQGCNIAHTVFAPDDKAVIAEAIRTLIDKGCQLLILTGGMSVDPDDVTKLAIAEAGAEDTVFGTPVLPGAMFLYARIGAIPVLGLPACVIYYQTTIFDIVLPRVLAGETITRADMAAMAHGGLCHYCDTCRYPVCPFGK